MNILQSPCWQSDLDETLAGLPDLEQLAGKTVLVTGGTGLICSAVIDLLIRWNQTHPDAMDQKPIGILAAGRNESSIRARFAPVSDTGWFGTVRFDAVEEGEIPAIPCDFVIYGAGNASPDRIAAEPVETILANITGLKRLLDAARRGGALRALYISSSEIYGANPGITAFREDDDGRVDPLNPRNSYAMAKRTAETLCVSFAEEYGMDVRMVRPGHIYGPTASRADRRVGSAWMFDALDDRDITMKSDGTQRRSYCHCLDCAAAMLMVLLRGQSSRAYNIGNTRETVSIRELAEQIAACAHTSLQLELPSDAERRRFNPMENSSLDSARLQALGWETSFGIERGIRHTLRVLEECRKEECRKHE